MGQELKKEAGSSTSASEHLSILKIRHLNFGHFLTKIAWHLTPNVYNCT